MGVLQILTDEIEVDIGEAKSSPDSIWEFKMERPMRSLRRKLPQSPVQELQGRSPQKQSRLDRFCSAPVAAGTVSGLPLYPASKGRLS